MKLLKKKKLFDLYVMSCAAYLHISSVKLNELRHEREADACALLCTAAGRRRAVESIKNMLINPP